MIISMACEARPAGHRGGMSDPSSSPLVRASFSDPEAARKAIGALENAGIDGGRIDLQGLAGAQAKDPDRVDPQADRQASGVAGRAVRAGAIIGGLVGAVGLGLIGWIASGVMGLALAMAIGGLVAGAGVGLAAGGYSKVKQAEAWEQTFDAVDDANATVVVQTAGGDDDRERVEKILRSHQGTLTD